MSTFLYESLDSLKVPVQPFPSIFHLKIIQNKQKIHKNLQVNTSSADEFKQKSKQSHLWCHIVTMTIISYLISSWARFRELYQL